MSEPQASLCLLPNLGLLRNQLEASTSSEDFLKLYFNLEQLPYSLGATYQAFMDFIDSENGLLERILENNPDIENFYALGPGGRDQLCYRIDSFLEAALCAYIR